MSTYLILTRDLAWMLYAGPFIAFTALLCCERHLRPLATRDLLRCYRSWGAGLGISLGVCIFSALLGYYLEHGSFQIPSQVRTDQVFAAGIFFGFLMWVSNIKLEVWTLDPLRKLDESPDTEAYQSAVHRLRSHMIFHSILIFATHCCCWLAEHID
jgi:hypothetical protein